MKEKLARSDQEVNTRWKSTNAQNRLLLGLNNDRSSTYLAAGRTKLVLWERRTNAKTWIFPKVAARSLPLLPAPPGASPGRNCSHGQTDLIASLGLARFRIPLLDQTLFPSR